MTTKETTGGSQNDVNTMSTQQASDLLGVPQAQLEELEAKGIDWKKIAFDFARMALEYFLKNPPFNAGGNAGTMKK